MKEKTEFKLNSNSDSKNLLKNPFKKNQKKELEDNEIIEGLRSENPKVKDSVSQYVYEIFKKKFLPYYIRIMNSKQDAEDLFHDKIFDFFKNISISTTINYGAKLSTYFGGMMKIGLMNLYKLKTKRQTIDIDQLYRELQEYIDDNTDGKKYIDPQFSLSEFVETINKYEQLSQVDENRLSDILRKNTGKDCYEMLVHKYYEAINNSYQDMLQVFTAYKNEVSLRNRVKHCKREAQKVLTNTFKLELV